MNEKFHNSIRKAGEEISLSHEERARMLRTLRSYMEMKPLRTVVAAPAPSFGWFFTVRPVAVVLVFALFISSAGVSYAAENALPGDILYPVKTRVNEPVKGALAVSASAKAAWAMDVSGERVKEAATLAAEGRLDTATQRDIRTNFEQHAKAAADAITENTSESPETGAEEAVRFEARLSEYGNVLAQIESARRVDLTPLASSVRTEHDRITGIRARAESRVASDDADHSAAARMGLAAKTQLDASTKLAHAVSESLSSSSSDIVRAQLDDAGSFISAGENFVARESSRDALGAFKSALSATEKLGVFLQTSSDIHARTGLVVGEPQKSGKGSKNKEGDGSQEFHAAAEVNASATSSSTTAPFETGTSADAQKHGGDEKEKTENSGERTLPVSVPVRLEL